MGYAQASAPVEILHVDDDADFACLTRLAFEQAKCNANLNYVNNGKKCLQFLRRQRPYAAAPPPDIVLLDLDMPVMNGREVLAEIIKDTRLKHLAVVVLTNRDEDAEILRMYQLRCNAYIRKPTQFDQYTDMIRKFADYWVSVVSLPAKRDGSAGNGHDLHAPFRSHIDHSTELPSLNR